MGKLFFILSFLIMAGSSFTRPNSRRNVDKVQTTADKALFLNSTIKLAGVNGRIDHMAFDNKRRSPARAGREAQLMIYAVKE